jgi:hypothetical protein
MLRVTAAPAWDLDGCSHRVVRIFLTAVGDYQRYTLRGFRAVLCAGQGGKDHFRGGFLFGLTFSLVG